jgi:hypothetical protein
VNTDGPRVWLEPVPETDAAAKTRSFAAAIRDDARAWALGRNPWIRLPILLWLAWILLHHLTDPDYASLIAGLNLGIHELGHFVFAPFGEFLTAAGGTLLQCIVPIVGAIMFLRQRDWFAITFATGWLATNFFNIAPYVADARARELPLVSPGAGDPIHDWYYLLGRLHLLHADTVIGSLFQMAGTLTMAASIAAATWLLVIMLRSRGSTPAPQLPSI